MHVPLRAPQSSGALEQITFGVRLENKGIFKANKLNSTAIDHLPFLVPVDLSSLVNFRSLRASAASCVDGKMWFNPAIQTPSNSFKQPVRWMEAP